MTRRSFTKLFTALLALPFVRPNSDKMAWQESRYSLTRAQAETIQMPSLRFVGEFVNMSPLPNGRVLVHEKG